MIIRSDKARVLVKIVCGPMVNKKCVTKYFIKLNSRFFEFVLLNEIGSKQKNFFFL